MHKDLINAIQNIDSAVFTGDSFLDDDDNREHFRKKMIHWEKEMKILDGRSQMIKEEDKRINEEDDELRKNNEGENF